MDGLATAEGRAALGQKLGALGTIGKVAGGVGGAVGLGASVYDAHQSGPSFSNVAGGAVSGAVLGASIGSVFPGPGTAIGAAAGGVIGGATAFLVGETHHHVTINVNGADPQAVTQQIDQYYRNMNRRAGVPATP
jgi:phage tail tape-measure protein